MAALPAPEQCRRRERMAQPDGTGYALASNTRYTTTGWIKENPTRQILLVVYRGGYAPPAQP